MSIKTILFDLDGTLIDTNALIHESFKHTLDVYGYSFTDEEILKFNGPPLVDTFTALNKTLTNDMIKTYRTHNLAHHNDFVTLFPGVQDTLQQLKDAGIQMGIVSTKMRTGVKLGLDVTGITDYFQTIISFDDVEHAKPHPEPVLKAIKLMNADPTTTLMVGDNSQDIEAGINANVQTAGVAWSMKGKEFLNTFQPTYMLEQMDDLMSLTGVKQCVKQSDLK